MRDGKIFNQILARLANWAGQLFYKLGRPFYILVQIVIFEVLGDAIRFFSSIGKIQPPRSPSIVFPPFKSHLPRFLLFFPTPGAIFFVLLVIPFWFFILRDLPHPDDLIRKPRPLTTKIYDRNGNLLFKIFRNQNRTYIPLRDIPLTVQQATIAIEDAEFYSHPGFSVRGIARAVERNVIRGQLTGGSTITQQLVKNALLSPERTMRRKVKEVILALWTELSFPKDKILEMYLNEVSYGGTAYGIEEASLLYFKKGAKDLTLGQATLLAGLPAAPTRFSPFGANPELARSRQLVVLARMVEEGYITGEQARDADREEVVFSPQHRQIKAPHFVMFAKQILVEKYGERLVEEGGLEVLTSLNLSLQEKVEEIVASEVTKLARLNVSNGAALVTKPGTGEVLAMVGSRDYFDPKGGNFNVTTALRQPGSAIKPVNYAYALGNGYSPSSIIEDSPVTYKDEENRAPPYTPRNYDNRFRGRITLRTALGSSLNVPAVKVLAASGVSKMVDLGRRLGITSWEGPRRFGLPLTLGAGEVRMTELAVVYGALANYGKRIDLDPILEIRDHNGKILERGECNPSVVKENRCGKNVVDSRVAFLLTDILKDNRARVPVFGPQSLLVVPSHPEVAVKTGTSQNLRDNWAIGYTKDFLAAVWVGNNDNRPMARIASGVTGATPIWASIMQFLLKDITQAQNPYWEVPPGVVRGRVCAATTMFEDWFLEENQPKSRCLIRPSATSPIPTPTPATAP